MFQKNILQVFYVHLYTNKTINIKHSTDDLLNNENVVTMFLQRYISNVTQQTSSNIVISLCVCWEDCYKTYTGKPRTRTPSIKIKTYQK